MFKTKIRNYLRWQRVMALTVLGLLIGFSLAQPHVLGQAVTEGYNSDIVLQRGMIIRIKKDDSTKVEPVTMETADQMHGIVVNSNDAPVSLSGDGERVFVATTGHYDVLVSTQAGAINTGDFVTISAVAGIGMKAGSRDTYVIGRALAPFDGNGEVISTTDLKDSEGKTRKVSFGRVSVDTNVARNPLLKGETASVPEFLRRASETLAGKPVDAVRVYIGMVVFLITTVIAGGLLYGGVRSGIISIGRNPLGKKAIIRSMFQVVITGLIVFLIGLFGVYLILRL
jgi:hypothetical protein